MELMAKRWAGGRNQQEARSWPLDGSCNCERQPERTALDPMRITAHRVIDDMKTEEGTEYSAPEDPRLGEKSPRTRGAVD